ncbi:MAG: hypothetical protein JWR21_1274 [Herminiimonas sp.]|nr:hypothetical protein [Herminiimonas sp.]MDB5853513.1 hypothetical protein [Herminiimonas sp.]
MRTAFQILGDLDRRRCQFAGQNGSAPFPGFSESLRRVDDTDVCRGVPVMRVALPAKALCAVRRKNHYRAQTGIIIPKFQCPAMQASYCIDQTQS